MSSQKPNLDRETQQKILAEVVQKTRQNYQNFSSERDGENADEILSEIDAV